jgi:hypothetical protein
MGSNSGTSGLSAELLDARQHLEDAIKNIQAGRAFILDETLYLIERCLIRKAMEFANSDLSKTSQVLSLSEVDLRYRLRKFNLLDVRKAG